MQTAQQLSTQLSATRQDGVSDSTARNLQAGLQQNNALAEKAAASYQRAQAFETVRARLEEHGISFGGDISDFMRNRLGVSPKINALATLIILVVSIATFIGWWMMAAAEKRRKAEIAVAMQNS